MKLAHMIVQKNHNTIERKMEIIAKTKSIRDTRLCKCMNTIISKNNLKIVVASMTLQSSIIDL